MMSNKKKKIILIVCAFVFLMACTVATMVTKSIYCGDDIHFHYARFAGIREGILGGQFPIKYYNSWGYTGGYFSPLFYGDLFLIPFVLLSFLGIPLKVCYFFFIYALYFTFWIVMFFFSRKYLKNDFLSILCATIFTSSHYMFYEIFGRVALGEAIAVVFYFVLLLGVYNMLHENYSKPWLFAIAFCGILFSHMTTLFFAVVTLILVVLFNCKKLFCDKKFWIKSGLTLGVFLIVGLYFIASFIEMYFADTYRINKPWITTSDCAQNLIDILGFTGVNALGSMLLCIAILLKFLIKQKDKQIVVIKIINRFLLISLLLIVVTSKLFPWKIFDKIFGLIQFPWRLNFIISILLSVTIGLEINIIYKKNRKLTIAIIIIILTFALINNNVRFVKNYNERDLLSSNYSMFEWHPVVTVIDDFKDRNIYDNSRNTVEYERKKYTTDVNFVADENDEYYIVPIVYYKGYQAILVDENGKKTKLAIESCDNGMIKIHTKQQKGRVYLHYAGTAIQNVTFWISFVGALVFIVGGTTYAIINKKKKRVVEDPASEALAATPV